MMSDAPTMMYPLLSINRIAWNPNKQSYLFIASGYNNGFVRLHCVRHMNNAYIEKIKFNSRELNIEELERDHGFD